MGIQTASQAYTNEGLGGFSFRNKIINGAMEIDQRNAGAEVNPATHNGYQLDRWTTFMDVSNKFKVQQLTTSPPAGFTHYMRLTVTNAYTSSAGERFALNQKIEGYNLIDTEYGLATAKPMTLSFWVRSSLTGTFGGTIHGETATGYYYPFSYTISSANTWEKKTVSILPLTASTPNSRTTGTGMRVWFDLGSGDTQAAGAWSTTAAYTATGAQKWLSNAGATLDFTGVQLEIGNQATPFERRPFGIELQLCQRYYQTYTYLQGPAAGFGMIRGTSTGAVNFGHPLRVPMRTTPSEITLPGIGNGTNSFSFLNGESYPATFGSLSSTQATADHVWMTFSGFSSLGSSYQCTWGYSTGTIVFKFGAEL